MRIKAALIGAAALIASAIPAAASAQTTFGLSISSGGYYSQPYGYDYGYRSGYNGYGHPGYGYAYPSRYYRHDRNRHWDRGRHNGWRNDGRHGRHDRDGRDGRDGWRDR